MCDRQASRYGAWRTSAKNRTKLLEAKALCRHQGGKQAANDDVVKL